MKSKAPVVLTIAGSDNSGGAGIQADLKTFTALKTYGTTAITCVVAENSKRVADIHPIPPQIVVRQIELISEVFPIKAAKTGMLYSKEIILHTAQALQQLKAKLVIDPVMVASSGTPLLKKSAMKALGEKLIPLASLVTPNLHEAQLLTGEKIENLDDLQEAAFLCAKKWGVPFLIKGGHLQLKKAVDVFSDGKQIKEFSSPMIPHAETHGTGCTYSAAICAYLGKGEPLPLAIFKAKHFIFQSIRLSLSLGKHKALNHLHP